MPAIQSQLDPRSADFRDNVAFHRALVDELDRRLAHAADGGGQKARDKHVERGKLLVRERIVALLDPASPFLEIAPLAAEDMYDQAAPAAGVDQVDAGQVVLARDLLRTQVFLHRHREVGAALDRGVVGNDHHFGAMHAADAGEDAGGRRGIVVHAARGERAEFQERRAGVEQRGDPLARQQLAALDVLRPRLLAAALGDPGQLCLEIGHRRAQRGVVVAELGGARIDLAGQRGHARARRRTRRVYGRAPVPA